jgi:hypothetical protein
MVYANYVRPVTAVSGDRSVTVWPVSLTVVTVCGHSHSFSVTLSVLVVDLTLIHSNPQVIHSLVSRLSGLYVHAFG